MNEMGKLKLQGKHLVLLQEGAAWNVGLCNMGAIRSHTGHPMALAHCWDSPTAPQEGSQPHVPGLGAGSISLARPHSCCRLPVPSPACPNRGWGQGSWQESSPPAAGTLPQSGSTCGKHSESLSVSLTVIQLGLCQEEVAAWRNASTF